MNSVTTEMKRVVVGYDASPEAELAVDWAISRARTTSSALHIMHVLPVEAAPGLMGAGFVIPELMPDSWQTLPGVIRATEALGGESVFVTSSPGNPAGELVEASKEADLVVVGSRGRSALASGLLGSTGYAVAAHCSCPVVVVRSDHDGHPAPELGPNHPVVVGIEDLNASQNLVRIAADLAAEHNAPLRIVRATHLAAFGDWATSFSSRQAVLDKAITDHDLAALAECADQARLWHPELTVEEVHTGGEPAAVLIRASHAAGLIVIGSRGRGGFSGLLLGSVSHEVIHLANCPVLVVRTEKRRKA